MDRSERIGITIAVVGHVVLFGLLSAQFLPPPKPMPLEATPIEVSLATDVGLQSQAAESQPEPPAPKLSPVEAPVEPDAAPPVPEKEPEPVAKPKPTPPKPEPSPEPRPEPAKKPPEKPVAAPKPAPKPSPRTAKPSGVLAGIMEGISNTPSKSTSNKPSVAHIDARALAGITEAIRRQIQPCADRQVIPGPGANEIVVTLNLRLNRDGTLASAPTVVGEPKGVNDSNARYTRRVIDLGVAAFKGCSPLELPDEYYSTPNGGWNNINYNWQLR